MNGSRQKFSFSIRLACLWLAVYLFNFSIDSRDAHPDTIAEDLSINDIESFFEFVAEHVMGIDNAVEEHDERDIDDGRAFQFNQICFSGRLNVVQACNGNFIQTLRISFEQAGMPFPRSLEIKSPPPKA